MSLGKPRLSVIVGVVKRTTPSYMEITQEKPSSCVFFSLLVFTDTGVILGSSLGVSNKLWFTTHSSDAVSVGIREIQIIHWILIVIVIGGF